MVTGTMVNYYFNCKRQCWLFYHRVNMEDNSVDVGIGKAIHEVSSEKGNSEIKIDNIVVDKITDKYLIEKKKSDNNKEAAKWQILYYLNVLESKGISRIGKIEYVEKNTGNSKVEYFELNEEYKVQLQNIENDILVLVNSKIPGVETGRGCKKCSYYEYCFI